MARILFTWELGWQLNHLSNIAMVSRRLAGEGHELAIAARELQSAPVFFAGTHVQYYQAPFKQGRAPDLPSFWSYAHLLHTAGYADPRELAVLVSAWLGILASFKPDVVVFDHSPTALLASRAVDVRRVLIGSGFVVPPIETPLGIFPDTPRRPDVLRALMQDEQHVLTVVNRASEAFNLPPLPALSEIYGLADTSLLLTFPELDPFSGRTSPEYYGVWPTVDTSPPSWPEHGRKRIFAYLSRFPSDRALLDGLTSADAAVLAYAPGIPAAVKRSVAGERLHFTEEPVSLDAVASECDLFVSHGNHTSVARMLLKGVPQLMIPRYKEQLFTARRVRELGAGAICGPEQDSYLDDIIKALEDRQYREAATRFSQRHRTDDAARSADTVARKLTDGLA